MSSPQQIEQQIEQTRARLSSDVSRIEEKVSPGKVVGRRMDRVKGGAQSFKDRVMGSMPSMPDTGSAQHAAGNAGSQLSSAGQRVGDAASNAPQAVRQQTQGNPFGAGLAAFGVGMVIASLLPASEKEKQLAAQAEQKAQQAAQPLQEQAKQVAGELKESAQQSAQQVKEVATDAAGDVAGHAQSAADDVRGTVQS